MNEDKAAELLNIIGDLIEGSKPDQAGDTLFHAEVEEGSAGMGIFDDFGDHIMMRDEEVSMSEEEDIDLFHAVLALWKLESPERRWAEMEYVIRDGRFTARFVYDEDIERTLDADGVPDTDAEFRRRDAIIARHLGEKPIRYPPLLDSDEAGATFRLDEVDENGLAWTPVRPSVSPAAPAGDDRPTRSVSDGKSAELLVAIGNLLERYRPAAAGDTLLYAPVSDGSVGTDIFDDLGDQVRMRSGSPTQEAGQALRDALSELWELEPPERRWVEMEYVIRGGRFEVRFVDEADVEGLLTRDGDWDVSTYLRRRDASIAATLGDKPIHYPTLRGRLR